MSNPKEDLHRRLIIEELSRLAGARLQRLDVVDERELVLELRVPGQTLYLLVCARIEDGRIHLIPARPERKIAHGPLQAFLRTRLVGQKLSILERASTTGLRFTFEKDTLEVNLKGGKRALLVSAGGGTAPPATPWAELPSFVENHRAQTQAHLQSSESEDERRRRQLSKGMKAELKKLKRLERHLEQDEEKLKKYEQIGHHAELLKTVLTTTPRGVTSVPVYDWLSGQEVSVELDPKLSIKANMQRMFSRAKKAKRGRPQVEERWLKIQERIAGLEEQLSLLARLHGVELVRWTQGLSVSMEGWVQPKKSSSGKSVSKKPIEQAARRFEAVDGSEIWVGRGASANDRLTFSFARGDDLWLHARGTSGAHVVIKATGKNTASPEAVLDAAHLAIHHSSQKNEHKAEVMVAEVRDVKKTKGAAPGLVGVSKSRTILVRIESERLDRLYGRLS